MSEGSRSGVNWMRLKLASTDRASALASVVLPVPGKILQQDVAAAGKRGQQLARRGRLALHDPGDIGRDPLVNLARRLVAACCHFSLWCCRLGHRASLIAVAIAANNFLLIKNSCFRAPVE